jgi:hypothetical protein
MSGRNMATFNIWLVRIVKVCGGYGAGSIDGRHMNRADFTMSKLPVHSRDSAISQDP